MVVLSFPMRRVASCAVIVHAVLELVVPAVAAFLEDSAQDVDNDVDALPVECEDTAVDDDMDDNGHAVRVDVE